MSESYNGWTNFETWQVGVEIANVEALYFKAQDIVTHSPHPGAALREWVESIASFHHDWDLGPVDWVELLDSVRDG